MSTNRIHIAEKFIEVRFYGSDEMYKNEWRRRFRRGEEWQLSDYTGRKLLQQLAPDVYPVELDTYFL